MPTPNLDPHLLEKARLLRLIEPNPARLAALLRDVHGYTEGVRYARAADRMHRSNSTR